MDALIEKVARDPAAKRDFVRAIQKVEPNWQAPIDVVAEDLRQEFEAKLEKERVQRQTERVNAMLEEKRRKISEKYGEEAVKAIEEDVMTRHGTADYDLAARIWAAEQPPPERERRPEAEGARGGSWSMPEIDVEAYAKNPKIAAKNAAYKFIDELRKGKR